MLNKKFIAIASFFLLFLVGCSTNDLIAINGAGNSSECNPYFFRHYTPKNNEIVGVGIAPINLNGFNAQKKSAISKALNEIAFQKGVTVNSAYLSNKKVENHSQAYSSAQTYSLQTVEGKKINAKIVKECKAPDGYYYVLMRAY